MAIEHKNYDPALMQGAVDPADSIVDASITRAKLTTGGATQAVMAGGGTIATTSTSITTALMPTTGTITSIIFSGNDALAANDTNYITWTMTNLGQDGNGSAAVLAASDLNTTKATGGVAVGALAKRTFTLSGTASNLVVTAGDRLRITATATGTLANTITGPVYMVFVLGTT